MTSDGQVYVWIFLMGDVEPTVCARLNVTRDAAGATVAKFVYGQSYLDRKDAVALDPIRLPLGSGEYKAISTPHGGDPDVFGVIADACPDDWGRYVITRRHGEQHFPTEFLLRSQEDRVGNLCFSRELGEVPVAGEPASEELLDEAWSVVLGLDTGRPLPPDLEDRVRANTGMGGARPKLTISDGAAQWIAKFPSHRDDRRYSQARLEVATLDLADLCGIPAARARLKEVKSVDGQAGLVALIKRFDRSRDPQRRGWLRDAFVSARTVLNSEAAQRPGQYMGTYTQLAAQLQRWSGNAAADRRQLFRRMVFNCCVSNTDDHDRNHGLLADELGALRLSPAFDILPRLHGTLRRYQAMGIGDEGALATIDNLLSSAPKFAIPEQEAQAIIDDVQHGVATHWKACLVERGMSAAEVKLLAQCFEELPRNGAEIERRIGARQVERAKVQSATSTATVPAPRGARHRDRRTGG